MRPISLKTKFISFFAGFTLFVLCSVIVYFYLSERQFLNSQAQNEFNFYLNHFDEIIKKEVQNSVYELTGLKNQIIPHLNRQFYADKEKSELIILLEKFAIGYPHKFTRIQLLDEKYAPLLEVTPVKVFGGTFEPRTRLKKISGMCTKWLPHLLIRAQNSDVKIFGPEAGTGGHLIYIILPIHTNSFGFLVAAVQLDFLLDQTFDQIKLPTAFSPIVADSEGVILFANDEQLINRFLNQVFPESDFQKGTFNKIANHQIAAGLNIKSINLFVVMQKNMLYEIHQLNSRIFRIAAFAVLFLVLSSLLVWYVAQRLTNSLQKVTEVALKVGEGDFSKKIEFNRKDEIGVLISTFNDMVTRLDTSYKSLNLVNKELKLKIEELKQTRVELSQKQRLALVGEAISKISHEIQNKIGGVNIWVQNLALYEQNDPTIDLCVQEIQTAMKSFMEMLVNFKKFYREPQLNRSVMNLETSINSILNRYEQDIQAKQLKIETSIETIPQKILADKELLEQALINLLLNAIYFSPQNGIIKIEISATNEHIKITIIDQGKGISEQAKEKIFQPFYTTKTSGSGLGLAIVNNIIKAHKGRISCRNNSEGGAVFEIMLPKDKKME